MTLHLSPIRLDWHSGISIFALDAFLKTVSDEYGWLGGINDSGEVSCILPYTIVHKGPLRMVRFRIETISLNGDLELLEEKTFLNNAVDYFRALGADVIIPATTNSVFRTYPEQAVAAPYGTYIIDLSHTEETLWGKIHPKHRNVIRNAMKKGVEIQSGPEFIDTAYSLVRDTFGRSRLGFMKRDAFKRMIAGLGENVKVLVASYQGIVQGCAILPFSNYSAYYVYGGSIQETLTGAMNYLQWEAIRAFSNLGVKRYDFVGVRIDPERGSKQDGLQLFKRRFGGELIQGYMWKCALRPLKSRLYSVGVQLLRGGDIVDREHHKLEIADMTRAGVHV